MLTLRIIILKHGIGIVFYSIESITFLGLAYNSLQNRPAKMLSDINIKIVYITSHEICCTLLVSVQCIGLHLSKISCAPLMSSQILKLMFIVFSCLIIFLNILTFIVHAMEVRKGLKKRKKKPYNTIVCAFSNCTNILCRHLIVFLYDHLNYQYIYFGGQNSWKRSKLCIFTAFLSYSLSLVIPFLYSFLSLARLMVMLYPLKSNFKSSKFVRKRILMIILFLVVLSMIVVSLYAIFNPASLYFVLLIFKSSVLFLGN